LADLRRLRLPPDTPAPDKLPPETPRPRLDDLRFFLELFRRDLRDDFRRDDLRDDFRRDDLRELFRL
jgi:hypothetical protein